MGGPPSPGGMPQQGQRRDPFGLPEGMGGARPAPLPPMQPIHPGLPVAQAPVAADGGEAHLREALSRASREVIEKIAWEVVPQLAETIIRQELDRLIKEREGR